MPGMIRKNKKAAKIAYKLLHIPKELHQKSQPNPPEWRVKEWNRNTVITG